MLEERHHGHHPGVLRVGHQSIDWRPTLPRAGRVRVKEHTCDCLATFYELCQAGGLMFVRRTHRLRGVVSVHESPWTVARETQELWLRLLMGSAR
ncbi:hypothetical protein [Streptosporangium lutulentum]|uniref:Uncharacterized protein n=1 Tax=Streptosporangium lutulentum TaxID=1461250 RepID=A0ABT9QGJ4_9ACTN|nr:hypothetical protein [Streptosporangium lutulentum]MDP9845812.1 hypothetical protein [Streptosporangium lutulentum]